MWFRSDRSTRRPPSRPRLEALEDRCVPAAGQLDLTFGSGGVVTTNFAKKSNDNPLSVAVQSSGKIIVAGIGAINGKSFEIARYNTNGTLDASFGSGGKVITQFDPAALGNGTWGFALQPDDKIVV